MTGEVWEPHTTDEAAEMLASAYSLGRRIRILGGGTNQKMGHPVDADVTLSTRNLNRLVDWQPEDQTVVVEGGMPAALLADQLWAHRQSAVLVEEPGSSTVGGIVASGRSGWRRYRYGPTRDRMLEVTLVTGEGRVITAGGRLVKNVTGYDIPRLAVGSLGSLGLISQVCMRLWPVPGASATVQAVSPAQALTATHRPLAVLETRQGVSVFLAGTPEEVAGQAAAVGGEGRDGLAWPDHPTGSVVISIRVPPVAVTPMVALLDGHWRFVAQHGVGEIAAASSQPDLFSDISGLREAAVGQSGALVLSAAPSELRRRLDPWGSKPDSLAIQRRLVEQFDPGRIINPGILPGRL